MDITTFMQKRGQAGLAYCQGEASPIDALATDSDPASFFGPDGQVLQGPNSIKAAYEKGAALFGPEGTSRLEIIQCEAEAVIGYWCGLQHAEVKMDGESVFMTLRITELFRREDDEWKLVHRHADMLKPKD